jgi:hypothetical protein
MASLEGWNFTTKLHPRLLDLYPDVFQSRPRRPGYFRAACFLYFSLVAKILSTDAIVSTSRPITPPLSPPLESLNKSSKSLIGLRSDGSPFIHVSFMCFDRINGKSQEKFSQRNKQVYWRCESK